tara:strand:+ start:8568 stop:9980 length:1413 start_codon:yes stop_codon:yes gene_type:complete
MRVLLINPYIPLAKFYGAKYERFGAVLPPYGLCCISGYVNKFGGDVSVIDANKERMSVAATARAVADGGCGLVGIYSTTLGYTEAKKLAQAIRKLAPGVKLILGGPHAIGQKGQALENESAFDFVCLGEGEFTTRRLIDTIESGGDLGSVTGLAWRSPAGVVENSISEFIAMDDLVSPSRELGDFAEYRQKAFSYRRVPFTIVQTARGCPFQCVFCSSPTYLKTIQGSKIRSHSIEWLDNELDYLVNHKGIREIYFVDDTFNLKIKRVEAICDLILRKYPKLIWSCNFEVNIATKELLALMQRAGCWSIMIGVESGSQRILDTIKKGIKVEQVLKVSEWCYNLGLMGRASFIIGNPGETTETVAETIALARKITFPFITFSLMTPFPGSEFFDTAPQYGIVNYNTDSASLSTVSFTPHGLTSAFLKESQRSAHLQVYLDPIKGVKLLAYLKKTQNREFMYHLFKQIIINR